MKTMVFIVLCLAAPALADMNGIRDPSGKLYCDTGFTASGNDVCVKNAPAQQAAPATRPRLEYGPESPNQGGSSGGQGYHSYSGSYSGSEEERIDHSPQRALIIHERITQDINVHHDYEKPAK